MTTAILEASDWNEDLASRISLIINNMPTFNTLERAKSELHKKLLEEKIPENVIDKIFILIKIEETRLKGQHRLWYGVISKELET